MSIMIRPMALADIQAVTQIEEECFSHPWSEKVICESFDNPIYHFFVAEEEETKKVVGYISYYQVVDEADICNVAVLPGMRGKSIGQSLVKRLIEDTKDRKLTALVLEVRASNYPAIHVYEKADFKTIGRRKNYYEDPVEDAILYGRSIE